MCQLIGTKVDKYQIFALQPVLKGPTASLETSEARRRPSENVLPSKTEETNVQQNVLNAPFIGN